MPLVFNERPNRSSVLFEMPFGVKRREAILKLLEQFPLHVNRKYCPILNKDPDLTYLLKKGKVVRFRVPGGGRTTKYTEIRLA